MAGGDARNALNALELAVESTPPDETASIHITLEVAQESIQQRAVLYDKDGDAHYDTISAFIKSVRGSDPDAALYWLAKMLYAGEDPRFILRRLIILAGRGYRPGRPAGAGGRHRRASRRLNTSACPEGIYPMVEATLYLATAPKSNSAGAYFKAARADRAGGRRAGAHPPDGCQPRRQGPGPRARLPVPALLPGAFYPPAVPAGAAARRPFLQTLDQGYEAQIAERLARWREAQARALG